MKCPSCGKSRYRIQKVDRYEGGIEMNDRTYDEEPYDKDAKEKVRYECLECNSVWYNE